MENNFARRNNLEKFTKAEKSIYDAIGEVEKVGAHVLLTDAVILLQQAKDKLSDYVDAHPPVHTDGPGDPPKCPEGYVWDDKAQACVLDVG